MMAVVSIDPHNDPRWQTFVETHPETLIFHHPRWMQVLEETYGYGQASLACVEGARLVGIVPLLEIRSRLTGRRAVSLPFSDYSSMLLADPLAGDVLYAHLLDLQHSRRWKYCEVRGGCPPSGGIPSASYKLHRIPLHADPQRVFKTFEKGRTQSTIKKFEKTGVLVERRRDAGAMEAFIRLNYVTRQKHGIPPQPDRFFEIFHHLLIEGGLGFVSVAAYEGRPIAASVFLHYRRVVYHKFNASDETFLHHRPNHGILWDAIRWGCEQGFSTVDLGRSDLGGEGLIKYKRGWGAVETDLHYYRVPGREVRGRAGAGPLEMLKPVFQRTPIPVLKAIGKVLYAHVG
jgi:hypothetical protein